MVKTRRQQKIAKIEGSNIYCLEIILELLTWAQLINLAESSPMTAENVRQYYIRRVTVHISLSEVEDWEDSTITSHTRNRINVHGKKYPLELAK